MNISEFGNDTTAILRAFDTLEANGGGHLHFSHGIYEIERQGNEAVILDIPSNVQITGDNATLKFKNSVNETNFWRLLGAIGNKENIQISGLILDGSTTKMGYDNAWEQNHGFFFYDGVKNVTIQNCITKNFSGDCLSVSSGCKNFTIENIFYFNYLRQGMNTGGGSNISFKNCYELESTISGSGSSIHVEPNSTVYDIFIDKCVCKKSILAGNINGLNITNNRVEGRIYGNYNENVNICNNIIVGGNNQAIQISYFKGSAHIVGNKTTGSGIYVSTNGQTGSGLIVTDNIVNSSSDGIKINSVDNINVSGNIVNNDNVGIYIISSKDYDVNFNRTIGGTYGVYLYTPTNNVNYQAGINNLIGNSSDQIIKLFGVRLQKELNRANFNVNANVIVA